MQSNLGLEFKHQGFYTTKSDVRTLVSLGLVLHLEIWPDHSNYNVVKVGVESIAQKSSYP